MHTSFPQLVGFIKTNTLAKDEISNFVFFTWMQAAFFQLLLIGTTVLKYLIFTKEVNKPFFKK